MIDVTKLREAQTLLAQVDTLFFEAGAYEDEYGTLSFTFGLRDLIEDLDIDIDRITNGDI